MEGSELKFKVYRVNVLEVSVGDQGEGLGIEKYELHIEGAVPVLIA